MTAAGVSVAREARRGASLDTHPEKSAGGCPNPRRGVNLWDKSVPRFYPVPCGRTNSCPYCSMVAAIENIRVLNIDAKLDPPTVIMTLTTVDPDFGSEQFRVAEASLWRALRRDYPDLRYYAILEWTTGESPTSGGHRRMHIHVLLKGLPLAPADERQGTLVSAETAAELKERVSALWERYTAGAFIVYCEPIRAPAGAIGYVAGHHFKPEQAPPPQFSGPGKRLKRVRHSQRRTAYFRNVPVAQLRQAVSAEMADDRLRRAVDDAIKASFFKPDARTRADELPAILEALGEMALNPPELQVQADGSFDFDEELQAYADRVFLAEKARRAANPLEVVRTRVNADGQVMQIFDTIAEVWRDA